MNKTTSNLVLLTLVFGCAHQAQILSANISEELEDRRRVSVLKDVVGTYNEEQSLEKPYIFEQTTKETI